VSSEGFAADLEVLGAARDRLGRLTDELAASPAREVPGSDAFGHAGLADAVREFADGEQRGLALLAGEAEGIRHRLAETIEDYRKADDDGAALFEGGGS
jgi:hypothetical protein